jgi:hypothetical protein
MRVLICGSRDWGLSDDIDQARAEDTVIRMLIKAFGKHVEIIHGDAPGADTLAGVHGEDRGLRVYAYPAKWTELGKRAGHVRNAQMLKEGRPDLVVAFHNYLYSDSKGTKDMIRKAMDAGVPVIHCEMPRGI